jgi:SAM-dependent methyltransferase
MVKRGKTYALIGQLTDELRREFGGMPTDFYDDLADYYELIFADWDASMARQGAAISELLLTLGLKRRPEGFRVLDVAAGIGTQSLPLASLGFEVIARDISPKAIARLVREARARGLKVDAAQADMRTVGGSVEGHFDAVIAFDNSVPHLLQDRDIVESFSGFFELLGEGGMLVISVRDYDAVDRSPRSIHPYGERTRAGRTFSLRQEWSWLDSSRYRTTFVIDERVATGWSEVLRSQADYYAIPVNRLLGLMSEAGFSSCRVADVPFYQPVLVGMRSSSGR